MKKMTFLACVIVSSCLALAQDSTKTIVYRTPYNLSGPRLGVTILSQKFINTIKDKHDIKINPIVAQIGWQIEKRFFTVRSGATAVSEWVFLIGGFEQERFLPSGSWLLGMRTANGFEFGAGPNLSLSGTAFILALGVTASSDEVNFPINLAVALSRSGPRYSFLVGFNIKS